MSARVTTKGLSCRKCELVLMAHLYTNLQKYRDSDGTNYLLGYCPGCRTPFRKELFDVEVVNRRTPTGVGSSIHLFQGTPTLDTFVRGEDADEGDGDNEGNY